MCPPHCGDYLDDDRALFHWPAPSLETARTMFFVVLAVTILIGCLGIALAGFAATRQLRCAWQRRRIDLDLTTCRAMVALAVVIGLVPSILAAWVAWLLSVEWEPLRMCGESSSSDRATVIAAVVGIALPLAVHRWMVASTKLAKRIDLEFDPTAAYRTAPLTTARFADPARAWRAAVSAFAVRIAIAAGVIEALFVAQVSWWGAPDTIRLFEIGLLGIGLAALHWPTKRGVSRPFAARLRRSQLRRNG